MKKHLLLLSLFWLCLTATAQDQAGEKIKQELDAHPAEDTFRVNRLLEMVFYSKDVNYYLQALAISKKIGYATGEAYALVYLGFAKSRQGLRNEGDSMYHRVDSIAGLTGNIDLLATLQVYRAYSTAIKDSKMGYNLLTAAEKIAEKSGNKKLLSVCQYYLAIGYANARGDLLKGMEYYLKSIQTAEATSYLRIMCAAYIAMGQLYNRFDDQDNAKVYFQKAREANQQLKSTSIESQLLVREGSLYKKAGKYTEAIDSYKKGLIISKDADSVSITSMQAYLAEVYNTVDSLSLAFKYCFSAAKFAKKVGDYLLFSEVVVPLSHAYLKNNMPDSAIHYALLGYDSSKSIGAVQVMRDNAEALANAYAYKKDFDNAYRWHLLFVNYKDSVLNTDIRNKSAVLQYNADLEKKQVQIIALNQEKKVQKNYLVIAWAVLMLIVVAAIILLKNNRQKQKANRLLQKQKLEIEEQRDQTNKALGHLQQTQKQLIQSEKMASLGELTAGIAHEIQNPLNFVNNFSEVNTELIGELRGERRKAEGVRNSHLEDELIGDIEQNMEKIAHHGKRADAIVKGMLQHSRTSTSQKEATDINKLADEYLRLAYHGLRAKDKNFNAALKTDFDETIGSINIIPQDIGRVVLNLITNAFYAVSERRKLLATGYEPLVSVTTKKMDKKVEISIQDNGGGIPQNIIDKIFQPFFTTKPTGEGTGLGLSLAYDIVKAHGGELTVASKDKEGTVLIIQLPTV